MKLELKHLCGYLPHKLKIKRGERILVINTGQGSSIYWVGISAVLKWFNSEMVSKPIPLLLPLSALTEPMEDGSVPIVELAKIMYPNHNEWRLSSGGNYAVIRNGYMTFEYDGGNNCFLLNNSGIMDQMKCYEYLFAHHFDIYDLIGAGLAIDKRTIK